MWEREGWSGQSQSDCLEGGEIGGWLGTELPEMPEDSVAPQSEERKARGLQVGSKGTATMNWIDGVVEA